MTTAALRLSTMIPSILISCLISTHTRSWSYAQDEDYMIQQVTEPVDHSEGPHWVESEQALYFVDISGFGVHRYDPYSTNHTSIKLESTVGVLIPIENNEGKFVIGYGKNISVLSWDGKSNEHQIEHKFKVDDEKVGNRFNDGKADSKGRLWIGTMGEEKPIGVIKMNQGSLYKVSKICELSNNVSPVSISNGIAWNADNTKMYYIDSPTRKIDVFDYNSCNGKLSNRRTLFDFEKNNITGVPDGMTIDTEDNLWVAVWGGERVIQVSSDGQLERSVQMPAERITSVAWGGMEYDTLFVTSMRLGLTKEQIEMQPSAGAVFMISGLQARGRPAHSVSSCILSAPNIA